MHHLIGVTEIAELLGVSKQRVHQLIHSDPTFPAPEAVLTAGHIFKTTEVEAWARRTGRL